MTICNHEDSTDLGLPEQPVIWCPDCGAVQEADPKRGWATPTQLVAAREAQAEAERKNADDWAHYRKVWYEKDAALEAAKKAQAEAERSFRAVDETLEATVNRLADVIGERDNALAANELLDDLYDWAKRWQAGRRENTEAHAKGRANYAQVILNAGTMNKELDAILEALANTKQAGAEAHTEDEVKP